MSKFERESSLPTLYGSRNRVSSEEFESVVKASTGMGYREERIKSKSEDGREVTITVFCRHDEFGKWIPVVFDDATFDNPRSALNRAKSREMSVGKISTESSMPRRRATHRYDAGRGGRAGGPQL